MSDIFQTLAKLKELYPEDIDRINQDAQRVKELLKAKNYAENSDTKELVQLCRDHIREAKKKLSNDRALLGNESAQRELWFIIESRQWVLDMVARDYDQELRTLEAELLNELP